MFLTINLFCALSFLVYGLSCIFSEHMVVEFARYGLAKFRLLTGVLQLLGGIGLLVGLQFSLLGVLAASGLSLLMLAGFITRLRIKDPLLLCLPSFAYMLLCGWLSVAFFNTI